jgi:thiol:disulfide interchange protein
MRLLLALAVVLGAGCGKSPAHVPKAQWHTDVDAAVASAKAQNKPLLIFFGADWDNGTKLLEQETLADPEVATWLARRFVAAKVDASDSDDPRVLELSKAYKVVGIPNLVILGPDGASEINRMTSYVTAPVMAGALRAATKEDAVREARFEAAARERANEARWEEERRKAGITTPTVVLTVDIPPAP